VPRLLHSVLRPMLYPGCTGFPCNMRSAPSLGGCPGALNTHAHSGGRIFLLSPMRPSTPRHGLMRRWLPPPRTVSPQRCARAYAWYGARLTRVSLRVDWRGWVRGLGAYLFLDWCMYVCMWREDDVCACAGEVRDWCMSCVHVGWCVDGYTSCIQSVRLSDCP